MKYTYCFLLKYAAIVKEIHLFKSMAQLIYEYDQIKFQFNIDFNLVNPKLS